MKTKYYKYTLKGEHSAEDAQRALGDAASEGNIVRVDNAGGETHIYVATQGTDPTKSPSPGGKTAAASGLTAKEVSESDVTRIG